MMRNLFWLMLILFCFPVSAQELPDVMLMITATSQDEDNSDAINLTVDLTTPASSDVTINIAYSGTAVINEDYSVWHWLDTPFVFTILAGGSGSSKLISLMHDGLIEEDEILTITITDTVGVDEVLVDSVSLTIVDHNQAWMTIAKTTAAVSEGDPTILDYIGVRLSSKPAQNVTVTFTSSNDLHDNTITFEPYEWDSEKFLQLYAVNDQEVEGTETLTILVTISSTDPAFNNVTDYQVTVTITDNDPAMTELLRNRGFENYTDNQPNVWKVRNVSDDHIRCDGIYEYYAIGECSYQFNGSASESTQLSQGTSNVSGLTPGMSLIATFYRPVP